jgi:opacity protein-like surface antigen
MTRYGTRLLNRRSSWLAAAIASVCLFSTPARAEDTGFEAGLRVGYGIPLGDAVANGKLSDAIEGQFPFIIDVGCRVIPNLFVGLYGQYGFAWARGDNADVCDSSGDISCSAHDIRLGIEAQFHFRPRQDLDPWIGIGLGFEWLSASIESGSTELSSTLSGFEFFNLQAGLDIAVAEHFYLGPFLNLSLAQFSSLSVECSSVSCNGQFGVSGDIEDKAMHEWLLIGVRGAYAP